MIDLGEGVVRSRTRFPRPAATKTAEDLRKAPGTARSLSQRVRSTSSASELESARRRLARPRSGSTKTPGARPINPRDVANRYRGETAGKRMGETRGANGHASKLPMLSSQRADTAKATRTETRIREARQKAASSAEVRVRDARTSKSRGDAAESARITKARQSYAQRVADARKGAAKGPVKPVKGDGKPNDANQGPGARPIKGEGGSVRPGGTKPGGTKPGSTKPGGSVRPGDIRPGGTRPIAGGGGTRPDGGRPIQSGGDVRPGGGSYSGPKDGVRPGPISADGGGVRPGGGATTGGGLTAGGGRPPITATSSVNRPGGRYNGGYGSYNAGFNSGFNYGYDPYYNSCFWNQWGACYPNAWCSWFWSPFYATGFCWQNYWLYGGSWGFGRRRFNNFNNCLWLGPFIPQTSSFIIYDDPEPQVIYVEAPAAAEAVAAEEVWLEGEAVAAPGRAEAPELAPEATNPELQRELNRAAGYYLTQGDRAFRETRYGDAAHFYAKAVEYSADSGILYLVLSDALFATGDYRYAAYALRQAFEREPELALNVIDKRDFYADPRDFDRQLEILEGYVEDHVLDMDARLVLSANYLFGGRAGDALTLLANPFSEELRRSKEGALMEESARRIVYGDEPEEAMAPAESVPSADGEEQL